MTYGEVSIPGESFVHNTSICKTNVTRWLFDIFDVNILTMSNFQCRTRRDDAARHPGRSTGSKGLQGARRPGGERSYDAHRRNERPACLRPAGYPLVSGYDGPSDPPLYRFASGAWTASPQFRHERPRKYFQLTDESHRYYATTH